MRSDDLMSCAATGETQGPEIKFQQVRYPFQSTFYLTPRNSPAPWCTVLTYTTSSSRILMFKLPLVYFLCASGLKKKIVLIKFVFYSFFSPYTVQNWGSLRQQLINHLLQMEPLVKFDFIVSIVALILQFMIVTSFLPIYFSSKYKTGERKQSCLCDTQWIWPCIYNIF